MTYGKGVTIRVLASHTEEEVVPLFVGRDDGTIEKYTSIEDADLGRPSLLLRGHRGPVTGIVVVNADEIFSSSLDGSIKQWNAAVDAPPLSLTTSTASRAEALVAAEGGNRVVRSLDGPTPLHCLAQQPSNGRLYAGGADGALHVVDGDRRSTWPGHREPITCIAFTQNDLLVTGSTDNQVLVWDSTQGKPFRLLQGHTNAITGVAVVHPDEDALAAEEQEAEEGMNGAAADPDLGPNFFLSAAEGALVSFSKDGTAKVWAIPDPAADAQEAEEAEAWMARVAARIGSSDDGNKAAMNGADGSDEAAGGEGTHDEAKRNTATVVCFQMPEGGVAAAGTEDDAAQQESEESEEYRKKRVSFEATPIMTIAADNAAEAAAPAADDGDGVAAPLEPISDILNPPITIKSALKAPERPLLRRSEALGTVALPATPFSVYQPPNFGDDFADDGSASSGAAGLVYVGSAQGVVWGLHLATLARTVLRFVADNRRRVNREVRSTKVLLRRSEALLRKECRKAVKTEVQRVTKVADKAFKAKRKAEREKKREERLAAAKAAAEERKRNAAHSDEEDEYFDDAEMDEEDFDDELDEDEDEEEEEEEAYDENGAAELDGTAAETAFATSSGVASPHQLRHLNAEQKAALQAFVAEKEKARDEKLAELKKSVEAHLAKVVPLAKATYNTSQADFPRLKFTSYARVGSATSSTAGLRAGQIGSTAGSSNGHGDIVLAVMPARGHLFVAQDDHVAMTRLTPGVVRL